MGEFIHKGTVHGKSAEYREKVVAGNGLHTHQEFEESVYEKFGWQGEYEKFIAKWLVGEVRGRCGWVWK